MTTIENIKSLLKEDLKEKADKLIKKLNLDDFDAGNLYITASYLNSFPLEKRKLIKEKLGNYKKTTKVLRYNLILNNTNNTNNTNCYCAIGAICNILYQHETNTNTIYCCEEDLGSYGYSGNDAYLYFIKNLEYDIPELLGSSNPGKSDLKPIFNLNDQTDITFKELSELIIL